MERNQIKVLFSPAGFPKAPNNSPASACPGCGVTACCAPDAIISPSAAPAQPPPPPQRPCMHGPRGAAPTVHGKVEGAKLSHRKPRWLGSGRCGPMVQLSGQLCTSSGPTIPSPHTTAVSTRTQVWTGSPIKSVLNKFFSSFSCYNTNLFYLSYGYIILCLQIVAKNAFLAVFGCFGPSTTR